MTTSLNQVVVNLVLLIGGVVLAIIVLIIIHSIINGIRIRRIAKKREGETFRDFANYFAETDVPYDVLKNTYEYFEEWNSNSSVVFPVRSTDSIADVYGIVDEDLQDAVEEILKKSTRHFIKREETLEIPQVETVEDVVLYVASAQKEATGF